METETELDLWPSILPDDPTLKTPLSILKEQSALLRKKTKGIIVAEIVSLTLEYSERLTLRNKYPFYDTKNQLFYAFYLEAPQLDDYRYQLFWFSQPIEMYPLYIFSSPLSNDCLIIESEESLIEGLRSVFNHQKTQSVMKAMIVQSRNLSHADEEATKQSF